MHKILSHPLSNYPPALAQNDNGRKTTQKSMLFKIEESIESSPDRIDVTIIDGMFY